MVRSRVAMPASPMGGRTMAASTSWSRRPAVGSVKSYSTLVWVPVQVDADQAGQQFEAGADHVAERQGAAGSGRHPLGDLDRVVKVVEHLGDQAGEDAARLG
ncbi:MAG TPA: hypothetical protein VFI65_05460 [Streptosporangiaceae bacterium]|nr:hypothetical protein [Streptosporangiaceae bacterium]